jgi:hypothetical protein
MDAARNASLEPVSGLRLQESPGGQIEHLLFHGGAIEVKGGKKAASKGSPHAATEAFLLANAGYVFSRYAL